MVFVALEMCAHHKVNKVHSLKCGELNIARESWQFICMVNENVIISNKITRYPIPDAYSL